ncbi:hypothetical protein BDZ91DRAFT_787745 [Kalaharituber pfeilii]|nr:hypothetical protein BDZ91DRAFT_787745 [Kalaharituber pfeilii]
MSTTTPLTSTQPPPPPPPTPVAPPGTSPLARAATVGFGTTEPSRRRYADFGTFSPMILDDNDGDEDGDGAQLERGRESGMLLGRSKSDAGRLARSRTPKRLSLRTGFGTIPSWYNRTPAPFDTPLTPAYVLLSPTTTSAYPDLMKDDKFYKSWEVRYHFSHAGSGIDGAIALVIFLGGPVLESKDFGQMDVEQWARSAERFRISEHGVSGGRDAAGGDGGHEQDGSGVVEGTIPLTKTLIEHISEVGGSLEPEKVVPYLREHLRYIVETASREIVNLPTLQVRIVCSTADIEEPSRRSEYMYFDTVYDGKIGGLK